MKRKKQELKQVRKDLNQNRFVDSSRLSEYLRHRTPISERWFQRKWKQSGMLHDQDLFNRKLGNYIPDCFNSKFKYVIEVDGTIHDQADVKIHDQRKDSFFKGQGYEIFRLKSFDNSGFEKLTKLINNYRKREKMI